MSTGSVDVHFSRFSCLLEELLWVVVLLEILSSSTIPLFKLFLMLLQLLHPVARVTAVRVDLKSSLILWIHLIDYILQGNHAVFEHPIPGVFFSMAAVIQLDVFLIIRIFLGIL